jgi:competence protein ComEC
VPVTGLLLVRTGTGRGELLTGDRVRLTATLRRPRNFGTPGEYDRERHLALRQVYVTAFVPTAADLLLVRSGAAHPLRHRLDSVASRLGAAIDRAVPVPEAVVLRALLLGDQGGVPPTLRDAYNRAGVSHILSISGFHVGVIALFLYQSLAFLARRSETLLLQVNLRRFLLLTTLPILLVYLLLTGAAPATVRSVLMLAACIAALAAERQTDPLDGLLLAALAILAAAPQDLLNLSFQLSFLALWGIIVLTPLFTAPFRKVMEGPWRRPLLLVLSSAAAITATLPVILATFHRASLAGLLANLLVVPLEGFGAVVLGFLALPLVFLAPWLAAQLFFVAGFLVFLADQVIEVLARLPLLPPLMPSRGQLLGFLLVLAALSFLRGPRLRWQAAGVLLVLTLGAGVFGRADASGSLRFTFLSVGQGEATLIAFPDGTTMLVDGGGSPWGKGWDVGERLLVPALASLGIHRLDYLVLSHPHPDHLQGLLTVITQLPVGEFWETGAGDDIQELQELRRRVDERGIPVRQLSAAAGPLGVGGARIEPLWPPSTGAGGRPATDLNDRSLVLRVVAGEFAALLTGDIGREVERELLHQPGRLPCRLLKVAHHGSRHSSSADFLAVANPRLAVISAGYDNRFGLPAAATLESLGRLGTRVYRTDLNGSVQVVYQPHSGETQVFCYDGRDRQFH